jgi:hypothetical protein
LNLTDPEWRVLVYVASHHGFSGPQLLRRALGRVLEARDVAEIKTPDGELAYDTIQIVRHVLLSEGARLVRASG